MKTAERVAVRGQVQGVGFRPHVARLAVSLDVTGWVRNDPNGVTIWAEGDDLDAFAQRLVADAPPAAVVTDVHRQRVEAEGFGGFEIRKSTSRSAATVAIAPDLATCDACLAELRDPSSRYHGYPFLNCTQCGPRYSVVTALPYDRPNTTLADWPMCPACAAEYADPLDRRYHAQPTACPRCGPTLTLVADGAEIARGAEAVRLSAEKLRQGEIVAVKGVGGYLLACDARSEAALAALRTRKRRREKPFALMARTLAEAAGVALVSPEAEALLVSPPSPVVLMRALPGALPEGVAPGLDEVGVMLPYAPVHHLLFDAGAPEVLVMTSGNRSSEPIAFRDAEALDRLSGLADAVLVGERPIARRVDDSVVRPLDGGSLVVRRARGYAPSSVAQIEANRPILALGGDLKCAPCLVVEGEAYLAPYVGDLAHFEVEEALCESIEGLLSAYGLTLADVQVVHDAHPGYRSTALAREFAEAGGAEAVAVPHHRAHIASVLAERGAWTARVVGLALDGTGYGDDGTVWGGEVFVGSLADGLERAAHLRPALLPGGDAAARWPVQAAAGFLCDIPDLPDLTAPPFAFPDRYPLARQVVERDVQTVRTTSAGRLFDVVAALCGWTREQTYEGQAAMWLEAQAGRSGAVDPYPMPGLDWRPTLAAVVRDRAAGRPLAEVARAFHLGLARALAEACRQRGAESVVASGGVFLNRILVDALRDALTLPFWLPSRVPVGDGGLALGQVAYAAHSSPS
ncbi:MAG: carbamoyltransferase HypF [Bacteroidota bacterium]